MSVRIEGADVLTWAREYDGPKFHAILADPPYELGFMGKGWDRQGVAFDPATWAALAEHLHPGGFIMAFASSRGWHRLAVAIEDAGLRIHPSIFGWAFGSGFPKATRIDTQIDKAAGAEWEGHRYGGQALKPALEPIIVAQKPYAGRPVDSIVATGAGSLWVDGGRVPTEGERTYSMSGAPGGNGLRLYGGDGRDAENAKHYAELSKAKPPVTVVGRWPPNFALTHVPPTPCPCASYTPDAAPVAGCRECGGTGTRPGCERVGTRRVRGTAPIGRPSIGAPMLNHIGAVGVNGKPRPDWVNRADADGLEAVAAWDCVESCPVRRLGEQSGEQRSRGNVGRSRGGASDVCFNLPGNGSSGPEYNHDTGGNCSRFFPNPDYSLDIAERIAAADPVAYVAKASRRERNAGCEGLEERGGLRSDGRFHSGGRSIVDGEWTETGSDPRPKRNPHPTVKPLALARWLATLLLPPDAYAPRRILIPFAGSGSEAIGAMLAGWEDVVGVEREAEYIAIAEARVAWWAANRDKAPEVRAMGGNGELAKQPNGKPPSNGVFVCRLKPSGTHAAPSPTPATLPGFEAVR